MIVKQILAMKSGPDRVVTVPPDMTVADAARVLSEKRIGAVVVSADGNTPEGILSERDIVRELGTAGAAVLARTDLPAVRRSLTEQIVRAYLANASEARKVSQIERMVATTYGTTVTDAMVARLLTAETLTQLLKQGRVDAVESVPALEGVPALADLKTGYLFGLLGRIGFVQPVLLSGSVHSCNRAYE